MNINDEEKGPLFYMRTWSGSYVEPSRWHKAIIGWILYCIFKLYEWWKGEK